MRSLLGVQVEQQGRHGFALLDLVVALPLPVVFIHVTSLAQMLGMLCG